MERDAFAKPEFKEYAKKNLVLVEADFPTRKRQPEALKKANQELKAKYNVEAFPTLVIVDGDGKKLGQVVGYRGGGPKEIIDHLEKHRKERKS